MNIKQTSKRKWWLFGSLIIALPFMFYLMAPLASDDFEINYDENEIKKVKSFLEKKATVTDTSKKPNIILILADDLGKTDISLYGGKLVQTPNIDAIGKKGVTFDAGTVTSPVCSPSRAGLITGRYQQRFGYEYQKHMIYLKNRLQYYGFRYFVDSGPWHPIPVSKVPRPEDIKRQGLPPTEYTLADILKKSGYHTGIIGKWHLGSADFNVPCNRGFDYQYGFYASHSLFSPEGSEGIVDQKNPDDFTDKHIWEGQRDGENAIYRNCVEIEEKEYLTDRIAEEAIEYIEKHKNEPFFLYLPFSAPHTPLQAPQSLYDQFEHIEDPYVRIYNAMIKSLDIAVGQVVDKVEKSGIAENTLIIFLSDNGGATYAHVTENAPLRGGKITNFEGGVNVPFMMRWDGVIPEQTVYNYPVSALDIFATSIAVANADTDPAKPLDGKNLIPFVTGENQGHPHENLYWKRGNNIAIRTKDWKLTHDFKSGQTLLFRIGQDPNESKNLADKNGEIVKKLMDQHQKWSADFPPALWTPVVYYEHRDGDEVFYFDN